jgi:hypothetical protein
MLHQGSYYWFDMYVGTREISKKFMWGNLLRRDNPKDPNGDRRINILKGRVKVTYRIVGWEEVAFTLLVLRVI